MADKTKKKKVNLDEVSPLELASVINPEFAVAVEQAQQQPQGEIRMPRSAQRRGHYYEVPGFLIEKLKLGGYVSRPTLAAGGRVAYKYGGIHINPANRGKLTETMQRTGKTKEELAHSKNPLTRKRAQFAINAEKWNHKR